MLPGNGRGKAGLDARRDHKAYWSSRPGAKMKDFQIFVKAKADDVWKPSSKELCI